MKKETRFGDWLLDNMDFYIPVQIAGKKVWMRVADKQVFTTKELAEIYEVETK